MLRLFSLLYFACVFLTTSPPALASDSDKAIKQQIIKESIASILAIVHAHIIQLEMAAVAVEEAHIVELEGKLHKNSHYS